MISNDDLAYLLAPPSRVAQIGPERGRLPARGVGLLKSVVTVPGSSYRYVYVADGRVVAALQVMVLRGHGRIANAYVAPAHRRMGHATALLRRAERDLGAIEHSSDLSRDGAAWRAAVEHVRENPMATKYEVFAKDGVKDRWGSERFVRGENHATFTKRDEALAFALRYMQNHPKPWSDGEVYIQQMHARYASTTIAHWRARRVGMGAGWDEVVAPPARKNPGGTKFADCVRKVERSAAERGYPLRSAKGICANIGRAKYGPKRFAAMAAAGRAKARHNPTAAIRSWQRKGNALVVHDLDVDDAKLEGRILRAPGYVLVVDDRRGGGVFGVTGAVYRKHGVGKAARWRIEAKKGRTATGTANLATGAFRMDASKRPISAETRDDLRMLFDWLRHEKKEHGRLPPPTPRKNPGCGCGCNGAPGGCGG